MSTDIRLPRAWTSSGSRSEENVRPATPGTARQAQRADAPSTLKQAAGRPPLSRGCYKQPGPRQPPRPTRSDKLTVMRPRHAVVTS